MPDLRNLIPREPALRTFALANLINTVGTGLFVTGGTLYLTQVVGLGLKQVGLGLSLTVAAALLVMVPLGKLADRVGAKWIYIALLILQSASMAAYVLVTSWPGFLVVAAFSAIADRGVNATVGALIHDVTQGKDRIAARAYLRAGTNVGFAVGTLLAGLAIQIGTDAAYRGIVAGNAVMFLLAALLVLRVPTRTRPPAPQRSGGPRSALRDRPYIAMSAANAVLTLHFELLTFALPLWVVLRTDAPAFMVSAVFVVNTAMVVLLQVRVSRRIATVLDAARHVRVIGTLLVFSCLLMATTAHTGAAVTVAVLILWIVVYSVAELLHAASEFSISFDLADDAHQGDYQSTFALTRSTVRAVAPALLSVLVLHRSGLGWVAVGCVLGLTAAVTARLIIRAVHSRTPGMRAAVTV